MSTHYVALAEILCAPVGIVLGVMLLIHTPREGRMVPVMGLMVAGVLLINISEAGWEHYGYPGGAAVLFALTSEVAAAALLWLVLELLPNYKRK